MLHLNTRASGGRAACRSRSRAQVKQHFEPSRAVQLPYTAVRAASRLQQSEEKKNSEEPKAAAPPAGRRQAPADGPTAGLATGQKQRGSELGVSSELPPIRLRIAVDVDEVLGRFVYTLNQFCLDHFDMKYDVRDYWIYEFAKIWNCSQEQSNHIVHEFFKSQHFNDGIPVIPGAHDVLSRLGSTCDLVVVTSRQHIIQDVTLDWIDRHYPGLFQEIYFGNHFALAGTSRKKSEICRNIGARVLIDDNPTYAIECAEAGIHVLLYDWDHSYPWSKLPTGKMHPLITVVRNWEEVELAITNIEALTLSRTEKS